MRGYRALKQSGHVDRIAVVKQALTEYSLNLPKGYFSSVVMGAGAISGEIVVRQYLLIRVGGINLNRALLLALGKDHGRVVFPLPREWREVLTQHDFEVAHFRSALLWQFYVCTLLFYGVVKIGKTVFAGITSGKIMVHNQKHHAYFVDLGPGNLPKVINGSQSHDVISWYVQWSGRKPDIEAIHHSVANSSPATVGNIAVLSQRGPLPVLTGWLSIINYAVWGLGASAIAAFDCLRGRWWHALLLNQAALAAQVRILPADSLASEYLFHNSGWIYRPLWTYEAERRGSTITLYFYSTNCESFKQGDVYPPISYGYQAMNWPRYLVWDEYQADFVRRAVGEQANISVVGQIWFSAGADEIPALPQGRAIAVFDVQPVRDAFYNTLGIGFDYYTPKVANQFLSDIYKVLEDGDCKLALKRKREIGSLSHPSYRKYIEILENLPNFVAVDSDISAWRLIEESIAVISMPFTSTALIGRELEKPSIYYDPFGLVQKDDRAAHGIGVLCGPDELRVWLDSVIEKQIGSEGIHD